MAPRLDTLAGRTVCMVWNHAFQADVTLPAIEEALKQKYPGVKVIPYTEVDAAVRRAAGGEDPAGDPAAEGAALRAVLKEKRVDAMVSGNGG